MGMRDESDILLEYELYLGWLTMISGTPIVITTVTAIIGCLYKPIRHLALDFNGECLWITYVKAL